MSFRTFLDRLWGRIPSDPVSQIEPRYEGFIAHLKGRAWTIPWETVSRIAVHHVTGSPEAADIHYILSLPEHDLRVALDTPGMNEFVRRLQHVPGFRHRTYADALRFCADTPVVIWENPKTGG